MLKNYLVDMLKTILEDCQRDIRRHAMSTLNSACHNRPELILGHLGLLMPYVMQEAVVKPELVREVQFGPFKHIIDDGLEVRKVRCVPEEYSYRKRSTFVAGRLRNLVRDDGDGFLAHQHH